MYKTKIDWCDSSWNPVTGCLHGCEYCYARAHVKRFGFHRLSDGGIHDLIEPFEADYGEQGIKKCPYPYDFDPTFHRYRLGMPASWSNPRTIFVCSMADLFGEWVPDEWIQEVFAACEAAPQHRYLFLSKNPGRYCDLHRKGVLLETPNCWYGATYDHSNWEKRYEISSRPTTFALEGKMIHDAGDYYYPKFPEKNRFVSFEPLLFDIGANIGSTGGNWHIIGAETGNRKGKAQCRREWVEHIVKWSDEHGVPVFMKESLRAMMGDDFRQEFPWEDNP